MDRAPAAAAAVAPAAPAIQSAVNCAEPVLARRRTSDLHTSSLPVGGTGIIWQVSRSLDRRVACDVWSTAINRLPCTRSSNRDGRTIRHRLSEAARAESAARCGTHPELPAVPKKICAVQK